MRRVTIASLLATCLALAAAGAMTATEPADHEVGPEGGLIPRGMHSATLLPDGRVLIAGGATVGEVEVAEAEIWDPATERFELTGALAQTRWGHTASPLPDGRVLIAGGGSGHDPAGEKPIHHGPFSLASAEIWSPDEGFAPAGSMTVERRGHTATTLPDGRVLIVGGSEADDPVAAEIWDSESGLFSASGTPLVGRNWGHTATLLPDGRVLLVGGQGATGIGTYEMTLEELASAEIWDPETGAFEAAGTLDIGRAFHTASLLPDGRVLIVGGFGSDDEGMPTLFDSAVAWDPATSSFAEVATMAFGRLDHLAAVLPDGKVHISGGIGFEGGMPEPEADVGPSLLSLVELFDPATETFEPAGNLQEGREYGTATALPDGRVLLVGGADHEGEQFAAVEVWTRANHEDEATE